MKKISILGGGSPFTAGLFEAIADAGERGIGQLNLHMMLYGRSAIAVESVANYGRQRMLRSAISLDGTTDLATALDGADVVVVQIRFGGLEAREKDENFAAQLVCPADETLGPSGLACALRQVGAVRLLSDEMRAHCPSALVVNMMNPLSLTTYIMVRHGLFAVGICELPILTLRQFAFELGLDTTSLAWSYSGLNHRGFLFGIKQGSVDLVQKFLGASMKAPPGIARDEIARLRAVPLKYFANFTSHRCSGVGRARQLIELRDELAKELRYNPGRKPARLHDRAMPWYSEAIEPLLTAWLTDQSAEMTLNVPSSDDVVRERRVRIASEEIQILENGIPNRSVAEWIARFEHHERLSIRALENPSADTIEAALRADMITPTSKVEMATKLILNDYCRV